jgi:hypothetical protein
MPPSAATRLVFPLAVALSLVAAAPPVLAQGRTVLFVDRDDDDANGVPDGDQASVPRAPELFPVVRPPGVAVGATFAIRGAAVRLLAGGVPLAPGSPIPPAPARLEIQAVQPGRAEVDVLGTTLRISALQILAVDGEGRLVDLARSHASIQRTPPDRLGDDPFKPTGDPDALRFLVAGLAEDLPGTISLLSLSAEGAPIDGLADLSLGEVPCPAGLAPEIRCGSTRPIRAVADDIDRNHPLAAGRSIRAELGGALAVASAQMEKAQMIRVGGPRASPVGPIERLRAKLRFFLVRLAPGGPPPVGGDEAGALAVARREVERANQIWGACGVSFGPVQELAVAVVDPPKPHLLAMGCDHGLPAAGGVVRVRVDGREVKATLRRGTRPDAAARTMAAAMAKAGFEAWVSENPPMGAGAFGTADVLVRRRGGAIPLLSPPLRGPLSLDPTMPVCLGRVDLEDGLQHFNDVDALAGTVEERALVKAFDDGDPSTVEVFLLPAFGGGGRIGESFIASDGGAVRNVILLDRAAIRADRASFTLAHELGHVLLDDPGHPDDFGADTPTRLMDADAVNASAYGPRRLLAGECARVIRQSGPGGKGLPILRPWPLGPLGK